MNGPTRSFEDGLLVMARKSPARRRLDRWVLYPIQSVLVYLCYGIFGLMPVDAASAAGGWLGRTIGPRLPSANRRALHNLAMALPELSDAERRRIVRGMWDNIGRTLGEYPHLPQIRDSERVEVVGVENVNGAEVAGRPRILMGAHIANLEIPGSWTAKYVGRLSLIYRALNNPAVDRLLYRARSATGMKLYQKGNEGTKAAMKALSRGDSLGMLLDQKLNRGIAVPFFGRDAMTAPALALFALRFDCAVVPTRVERLGGARFRLTFYPALNLSPTGDRNADIQTIMSQVNAIIEEWVRERPEQWFWMHRRWIDSVK